MSAALSDGDGVLRLSRVLALATDRNPRILAARAAIDVWDARSGRAGTLPDPVLRFGWYAEPIETRTGPQRWALALQQTIPWPARLAAASDVADTAADRARAASLIAARDVLTDVTTTFHELGYLHRALAITGEIEASLARQRDVAVRESAAGRVSAAEVVRAETMLVHVQHDKLMLRELIETECESLRSHLAAPRDLAVGRPGPLAMPRLSIDLDAIVRAAAVSNQEILLATLDVDHAVSEADHDAFESYPSFTLGGRYIATDKRRSVSPRGNGRDPVYLELGMSLPIWFGANRAVIRESEARVRRAMAERDVVVQRVRRDVTKAYWRAVNAERVWTLHERTIVPQAMKAAAAAESLYETGMAPFASVTETTAAYHHLALARERARADYLQAIARLERSIGMPLASRAEAAKGVKP